MEVAGLKDTDSLETWYIKAVEFERARRLANQMYGNRERKPNQFQTNRTSSTTTVTTGNDTKTPKTEKMTNPIKQEEIDRMRKEGICFNCKKKGHISRNCPEPRQGFFTRKVEIKEEKKEEKKEVDINSMTDSELGSYYRSQILGFQKGQE
jgi:hypothetical protein